MSDTFSLPYEALKKERARLQTLHSYDLLQASDKDDDFDRIVQVASYVCGTPVSLMSLVDADKQYFKARVGFTPTETSREVSFCSHAIQKDGIMEIPDALLDERFKNNKLVTEAPNIRFYAGSPLVSKNGDKLGTLCVIDSKPRKLSDEQLRHLETLSNQISALIELTNQEKRLKELNAELVSEMEAKLKEQKKVLNLFGRFVPEDIIAKHLEAKNGEVDDAELKNMTLMFCDIRGFTSIVEGLSPKQAVIILQHFYTIMSDIISTYSGMVNQYVGDEIFATFGNPFSFPGFERHAVFCALEMMNQLKDLNELCQDFISTPLKIGIGIHAGEVVTGTLGSSNKIEYSVTGDTVNTSKRIESLTQSCPNTILISHTVYEAVKDLVNVKVWTPMSVKGKAEPLEIYEVLSKK